MTVFPREFLGKAIIGLTVYYLFAAKKIEILITYVKSQSRKVKTIKGPFPFYSTARKVWPFATLREFNALTLGQIFIRPYNDASTSPKKDLTK
jgi:hypothetical protein